jgi:dihydrofolate reductase
VITEVTRAATVSPLFSFEASVTCSARDPAGNFDYNLAVLEAFIFRASVSKGGDMRRRRKVIVYIATSADGYIARPDGDVEWLSRPQPKGNYGIGAFFKSIDTILWGRKTYTKGIEMGMKDSGMGPSVKNYVFSRNPGAALLAGFEQVKEPIGPFMRRLRAQAGKDIWMMGGGEIIGSFLDEGEIDEFSIHVIPVLIGEGIPLIQPRHRSIPLKLVSTKKFPDGVVHLHYSVMPKEQWNKKPKAPAVRLPKARKQSAKQ